jgi:hypothetical protein
MGEENMPDKTVTGRLTQVERLGVSRLGNPRFEITLDDSDTYTTQSDASVSYEVTNFRIGRQVTLKLTRNNRVIGMAYGEGS